MTNSTIQQNLDKAGKGNGEGSKKTRFKTGYDPRRWLSGRGPKSPEQKDADKILQAVIWEELSRTFDTATMKPADEQPEQIDALRLAVRQAIKKDFKTIIERIAGKVTDRVDVTSGGKPLTWKDFVNADRNPESDRNES